MSDKLFNFGMPFLTRFQFYSKFFQLTAKFLNKFYHFSASIACILYKILTFWHVLQLSIRPFPMATNPCPTTHIFLDHYSSHFLLFPPRPSQMSNFIAADHSEKLFKFYDIGGDIQQLEFRSILLIDVAISKTD